MEKKKIFLGIGIAAAVLAVATVALCFALSAGGSYEGKVTDSNGGLPLSGVSVTDGRNVVKTDENGCFKLKGWRKARFVTVTVPAGYKTEKYYIPVDESVKSYDFTLSESDIPRGSAHSFLQISDTEINDSSKLDWLEHIKKLINEQKPAFLIHTGDICYEQGLRRHINEMNTENMGLPVRYVIGNHDYVDYGKYGEALYESLYGPVWYSFEVGNVHYVVTPFQTGADVKSGYNKDDRWRWLENDLMNTSPDMKVVMFNHTKAPNDGYIIEFDRKELDLKEHNLIAWVYGHYHYNFVENNEGVLNISTARPDCGGIDSSASGSRIINIDADGKVSTKMHYYSFEKSGALSPEQAQFTADLSGNVLFCDTVYENGKIYTATVDDDYPRECGVYCIDGESGDRIWSFETVNSVKNNVIVKDGKVFAQDCEGNVYCLDGENGKLLWQTKVAVDHGLSASSGICLDSGRLYTGCASEVTCLNAENGEKLWEKLRDRGEASPAEFIAAGDLLIVSSHWDALVALDKNSGKELWKNDDGDIRFRSSTPIKIDGNTLLVADDNAIMTVDLKTGEIIHKSEYEDYSFNTSAQPAIKDTVAYIPTSDKGIIAYSLKEHKILWTFGTGKALVYTAPYKNGGAQTVESSPVIDGGYLWFGGADGRLYCLDITDGTAVKAYSLGAPIFGKPAVTEDFVYIGDFAGRITKLQK